MAKYKTVANWRANLMGAFNAYIASTDYVKSTRRSEQTLGEPNLLSESSQTTYRMTFQRFAAWLAEKRLDMFVLDADAGGTVFGARALLSFLDIPAVDKNGEPVRDLQGNPKPKLASEIRYRFVRLLSRIYEFLGFRSNPAEDLLLQGVAKLGRNLDMVSLKDNEMKRFIKALPTPARVKVEGDLTNFDESTHHNLWRPVRDLALHMLFTEGGLTLSQAIGLLAIEVEVSDKSFDRNGVVRVNLEKRKEPIVIVGDAALALRRWQVLRNKILKLNSIYFFPSHRGFGRREGPGKLPGPLRPLHVSTVWQQMKKIFAAANINTPHVGPRILRNTLGVAMADDPDKLREFFGLKDERAVKRYVNGKSAGFGPRRKTKDKAAGLT